METAIKREHGKRVKLKIVKRVKRVKRGPDVLKTDKSEVSAIPTTTYLCTSRALSGSTREEGRSRV